MKNFAISSLLLVCSTAAIAADDPSTLLAKAGVSGRIETRCSARFFAAEASATAMAVRSSDGKKAYYVLANGKATLLGAYAAEAELQCLSPKQATARNRDIAQSEGIEGQIVPNGQLDVVCGFIDDTEATCWGFDPKRKAVVRRGGWAT